MLRTMRKFQQSITLAYFSHFRLFFRTTRIDIIWSELGYYLIKIKISAPKQNFTVSTIQNIKK